MSLPAYYDAKRLGYVCNPRSLSTGNGDVSSKFVRELPDDTLEFPA